VTATDVVAAGCAVDVCVGGDDAPSVESGLPSVVAGACCAHASISVMNWSTRSMFFSAGKFRRYVL
jgi:hypothetical protein